MDCIKTIGVSLELEDGSLAGYLALQRRSEANKTFHYVCQETWAGKMEEGESQMDAVRRECREELGESFYNAFDFEALSFIGEKRNKVGDKEYLIYHYLGSVSQHVFSLAKLHRGALPEFVFINQSTEVSPISSGKNPKENIVLFDDHVSILNELFANATRRNTR